MEFGYPGANTHLENHGVSEESFWPSFTDIMMVIVMVFLLVTVAVILNNWTLISDLKNSIQAQHIASSLAENRQEKNLSLEAKLTSLEKQMVMLNEKYVQEKNVLNEKLQQKTVEITSLQQNLESTSKEKTDLESLSESQKTKIEAFVKSEEALQSDLKKSQASITQLQTEKDEKINEINQLQTNYDAVSEEKKQLASLSETQKTQIEEAQQEQQNLQEKLGKQEVTLAALKSDQTAKDEKISQLQQNLEQTNTVLASLQSDRSETDKKLSLLQTSYVKVKESLDENSQKSEQANSTLESLKTELSEQADKLATAEKALKDAEDEKQRIIAAMNERIVAGEEKLEGLEISLSDMTEKLALKDNEIVAMKEAGVSQLRSLKGEYDTLDAKYQKLLRPARSAKGKFVVSITYKKRGNNKIIRIKTNPKSDYKSVKSDELHKLLVGLKKKHKKDLYLKIIIPNNSGLSYNEAWKFTSNLQRKYDYYHQ